MWYRSDHYYVKLLAAKQSYR